MEVSTGAAPGDQSEVTAFGGGRARLDGMLSMKIRIRVAAAGHGHVRSWRAVDPNRSIWLGTDA
jgi:hypothetical protein